MFEWFKRLWNSRPLPMPVAAPAPAAAPVMKISDMALAEARAAGQHGQGGAALNAYVLPARPPFVTETMAMDAAPADMSAIYNWAAQGAFSEGLGFLGYPYLAELSQRPEYRHISTIYAREATRKWIKLNGEEEKTNALEAEIKRFDIQAKFRELCEQDGFFGRSQLFIDLGHRPNDEELGKPLPLKKAKIAKDSVRGFKVVEPLWSYPGAYESTNPLDHNFYRPKFWYVMTSVVHNDRLLTIVGREMPDLLKPAYSFGGLSLSQMAKPYVDNWLRTRQSVSDLVHSFSTPVLSTDMSSILAGGSAASLISRAELFNRTRDNRGLMMLNKDSEEFGNVTTPLSGLHELQSQSLEQIASITGIPLVVLLGVTPSGLNASSDGEIKTFYATVKGYQERTFATPLKRVLDVLQLNLWGAIDPDISFEFVDLWEMDETAKAANRKSDADADAVYITNGVVDPEEVRERIANDENSAYFGMDLSAPAPEAPDDADQLDNDAPAMDAWNEGDHDRADNGQFGSGGAHNPHRDAEVHHIHTQRDRYLKLEAARQEHETEADKQGKVFSGTRYMQAANELGFHPQTAEEIKNELDRLDATEKAALARIVGGIVYAMDAEWSEEKHKRADNGQFGSGGGGAAPKAKEAPTTAKGRASERRAENNQRDRDAARIAAVEVVTKTLPPKGELPPSSEARQPFNSWAEAAAMAEVGQRQLTEMLGGVAKRMGLITGKKPEELTPDTEGSFLMIGPIKAEQKAMDKVRTDYVTKDHPDGDIRQLKDLCRATIACDTVEGMAQAIKEATAAGLVFIAEPKNNYAKPTPVYYRDVNTLVQLPNGMIAELQFNVVPMLVAKEKCHGAYNETIKIAQDLERKPPPDGTWPKEAAARYTELEDFQKREYGAAWEQSRP